MSVVNTASKMATGTQPKFLPTAGGVNVLSTISLTTTLTLNDLISMLQIAGDPADPAGSGATVLGIVLDSDQLDNAATKTITLDVGDTLGNPSTFMSAVNTAQAGGYAIPTQPAVLGYQPFVNAFTSYTTASNLLDTITVKVHAAAATPKAGTLRLLFEYTYDP